MKIVKQDVLEDGSPIKFLSEKVYLRKTLRTTALKNSAVATIEQYD